MAGAMALHDLADNLYDDAVADITIRKNDVRGESAYQRTLGHRSR